MFNGIHLDHRIFLRLHISKEGSLRNRLPYGKFWNTGCHFRRRIKQIIRGLRYDLWAGERRRYSDWLLAGWSGNQIPVGARFSAPVQTGRGVHPASSTLGIRYFPGVKSGRGVTLNPHPLLVPWSRKSRAKPLLPLWAVTAVQSLSACTRVHFNFSPFRYDFRVATCFDLRCKFKLPSGNVLGATRGI